MYNYFRENYILSIYQSGFQPGMSTITQLLEVYHKFCQAVDSGKEIRVVFLDIQKAFDKVWHKGLLYKLKRCGIGGKLLTWFQNYLEDRMQRVIINGQASSWKNLNAGVPQGSVLGPLLFLLFINDVSNVVDHCHIRMFADDTCLFLEVENSNNNYERERFRYHTAECINHDLNKIYLWSKKWLVTFSPPKTKSLTISNKPDSHLNPNLHLNDHEIDEIKHHKYLGLRLSRNLKWTDHIHDISTKARKRLSLIIPLKFKLDRLSIEIMYKSFVLPIMEYGNVVWGGTYNVELQKLDRIHVDGMRLITGATAKSNTENLYAETKWESLSQRRTNAVAIMIYKIKNNHAPLYLQNLIPKANNERFSYTLRNEGNIQIPTTRLETFKRSFFPTSARVWNELSLQIKSSKTLDQFKTNIKQNKDEANILYYYGERWPSIHHARLRLGCSKLNYDLCYNLKVIDNPCCTCGAETENAFHFFMQCPNYFELRLNLFSTISAFCQVTLGTILSGNDHLSVDQNHTIFGAVHSFIMESGRFN